MSTKMMTALGCVALFACTSDDSTNAPAASTLDPAETTATTDGVQDELLLESALLDDSPEPAAMTTLSNTGQGVMDGGGPLDGGGGAGGARWSYPKPVYKLLRAWGALVPRACITDTGWVDADGDGIPSNATFTFDCSSQPGAGATLDVTGRVIVADADDASASSGYRIDFDAFMVELSRPNGTSRTRTVTGNVTVTVKGAPPALASGIDIVRNLTVKQSNVTAGATNEWTHETAVNASYVPDADVIADPFARGSLTSSGQGTNTMQIRSETRTRSWTRQTDPSLHWNRQCRATDPTIPGFDSGRVKHTDDRGNVVVVTFTACGAWTITLDGNPI